jgi:hypothetical protein
VLPRSSGIRLSDLPGRDEAVVQEEAQNSVRKGAHLGPSNEDERARETRDARRETRDARRSPVALSHSHPAREVRVLKRYGVGERERELGADLSLFCCQIEKCGNMSGPPKAVNMC